MRNDDVITAGTTAVTPPQPSQSELISIKARKRRPRRDFAKMWEKLRERVKGSSAFMVDDDPRAQGHRAALDAVLSQMTQIEAGK